MSSNSNERRHVRRRRRASAAAVASLVLSVAAVTAAIVLNPSSQTAAPVGEAEEAIPAKLMATGAPKAAANDPARETSDGQLDWQMHATPRIDIPLAAISGSREDWRALSARGGASLTGSGRWTPLGPDNAVYPLNQYRNRYVYVPGEYVAAGRTSHSVIDPNCRPGKCRYWIANAGGGIWRTNDPFAAEPKWEFLSKNFLHNNTAALELDPNDRRNNTLYAGTGEPNTCRSGCIAGVGMYKSKDGGEHWSGPIGAEYFSGRGIGAIKVKPGDPKTIFVASGAQGSRGISSTCCNGVDRGANIPGAPHFGLWRSTDGGKTFDLVNQGNPTNCTSSTPTQVFLGMTQCSPRGARRVHFDPVDPDTVYATFGAKGIWRSTSNGDPGTWELIFAPRGPSTSPATGADVERAEFDVVALPSGDTRMYVGVGSGAGQVAKFFRSDRVQTGTPAFAELTNNSSRGYCDGQCNYDNYVYVPRKADGSAHDPDTVYLLGANRYDETGGGPGVRPGTSNGRAVLLSTDGGQNFTDMTYDAADNLQPHGIHPDQHSIVTHPNDWKLFLETGDGGVIRSNGNFVDDSGDCSNVHHLPAGSTALATCQAVTSRIPERLEAINKGLNTIHFYQVAYNPNRPGELAGGTQDNGSWMRAPGSNTWIETFIADGAYNGFDAAMPNYSVLSWQSGAINILDEPRNQEAPFWVSDTLRVLGAAPFPYPREQVSFIVPTVFHPNISKLMLTSREHVFRSLNGAVNPNFSYEKVKQHCHFWTGDGDIDENGTYVPAVDVCDDWKAMGDPGHAGRLTFGPAALCPGTGAAWNTPCTMPTGGWPFGEDRSGGHVSMNTFSPSDRNVVWAATSAGRIFITTNAGATDPATIVWRRIDSTATNDPGRYPTDIYVDPSDPHHAYITYSGYNHVTPDTPGHVFDVRYNPVTNTATFTSLDGAGRNALGDLPVGTIERDERTGDLYIGTDFGLARLRGRNPDSGWKAVKGGPPITTIPHLTLDQANRVLYVGTHGFGAWALKLSGGGGDGDDD